jgi:ABC transporter related
MSNAVDIVDVTKRYGQLTALDRINLTVRQGELFGLIGPDGAGKSSLYRILATLSVPDGGKAFVCGFDTVSGYRNIRTRIGYMPERFSLYQDLTVMENLRFFSSLFGVSMKKNYDLIAPIFSQLARFPDRKAGALSGGMKQKLALSCALIHRPEILLLDEPTTGVDAVSRNEFWDILATLRQKGITILVSTSYMDEATRCSRIAMIDKGHILDIDTPANLVSHLGENLFNAVASDMFGLLTKLRTLSDIIDCYTFGATLHIVGGRGFNAETAENQLRALGLEDVKIHPAVGNIEDLFIKLTRDEKQ